MSLPKVAIVTGGSSGIGLSIVRHLRKEGYSALSWDLNRPRPEDDIPFILCDVTNEKSVADAHEETKKRFGPCSILVNNCGLQYMAKIEEFPLDKWKQLIDVMLTGTFLCTKAVLPEMRQNRWGRIVNISSVHGKVASPFKSAYVAAKHGVMGLTKVAALETAEDGITVNAICPGFVDTPLMRNQLAKQAELNALSEKEVLEKIFLKEQCIKQLVSTDEIAAMVLYLVSDAAKRITGEGLNLSGGWAMGS